MAKSSSKGKTHPNAFNLAYAAKKGTVAKESLRGAAKHLFNTLSEEELSVYTKPKEEPLQKRVSQSTKPRVRAKRG